MANERGFAMGAAVRIRGDYEAGQLRELAKRSEDAAQTRRLLALATIYDGGARSEAAKIGGVGLQTVRDWVLAFNAVGPSGLVNLKRPREHTTERRTTSDFGANCRGEPGVG